jgi:alpha-tubulin suppressor-like RCC1 family protein
MASPTAGDLRFTWIRAGDNSNHICGLATDQKTYCWGDYIESNSAATTMDCITTAPVQGNSGISRCTPMPIPVSTAITFKDVATAFGGRCGLNSIGAVFCWGAVYNSSDQLEFPVIPTFQPTPIRFVTLSGGWYHYCGLTEAGSVYCWGNNGEGQVGDYSVVPVVPPPFSYGRTVVSSPALIAAP